MKYHGENWELGDVLVAIKNSFYEREGNHVTLVGHAREAEWVDSDGEMICAGFILLWTEGCHWQGDPSCYTKLTPPSITDDVEIPVSLGEVI